MSAIGGKADIHEMRCNVRARLALALPMTQLQVPDGFSPRLPCGLDATLSKAPKLRREKARELGSNCQFRGPIRV